MQAGMRTDVSDTHPPGSSANIQSGMNPFGEASYSRNLRQDHLGGCMTGFRFERSA